MEYWAYAIDTERTYSSALSFMTGLYPSGDAGPPLLVENQTAMAVPPINVTNFAQINATLFMQALPNNFQTVPIHSDSGNLNSTIFQGYDPNMCPIIGEIQMYNLASNASSLMNQTFTNYSNSLYQMLSSKNMKLPNQNELSVDDYKSIIQEIKLNALEVRYVATSNSQFNTTELSLMDSFMRDYYHMFLQGNDTIT